MSQTSMEIKMAALMSVPMCGWNPHWGCQQEALRPWGIPLQLAFGAWWDHGVSNLFDEYLQMGVDWVLTIDYDSIFDSRHVGGLIERLGKHAEIDALAALQCRRNTDETPLMHNSEWTSKEVELDGLPLKVDTAHFGLTIFRMDAFAKYCDFLRNRGPSDARLEELGRELNFTKDELRGMVNARMLHIPDVNGSYFANERTDPDIYFWKRWKDAGNTLYVDPKVSIGHMQPLVSEFDATYKPTHTHWVDWRERSRKALKAIQEQHEPQLVGAA